MYKAPPPEVSTEQFYETDPDQAVQARVLHPDRLAAADHLGRTRRRARPLGRRPARVHERLRALGAASARCASSCRSPDNRVTLADEKDRHGLPVARFSYTPVRQRPRCWSKAAQAVMEDILHAAGADEVITIDRYAHLVGGARMAADERHGVVDADCRSFAVPNLLITDGSVLPTQGSANPALTIMAVAARAADRQPRRLAPTPAATTGPRATARTDRTNRGGPMADQTVADHVLHRLREWGVDRSSAIPGDGINGLLAAWGRADDQPRVRPGPARGDGGVRGRRLRQVHRPARGLHGHLRARARSTCSTGCTTPSSTTCRWSRSSGRPTARAMGGSYQQEVDLLSLFKDVASEYVQMVTVPEQLPNVLDRAIRIAIGRRAPTAVIIPSDVQELEYSPPDARVQDGALQPRHRAGRRRPRRRRPSRRAADVLNAGAKVAILVGQGARGAARRGRARSPTCSAPASPRRCSARTCSPTSCPA